MKIAIDTHHAFNLLVSKGFTREQAESLVEVVSKVHQEVATKQDLHTLEYKIIVILGGMIITATSVLIAVLPLLIK